MNCEQIRKLVWEYHQRVLSDDQMGLVQNHLHSCKACAAEFDQFKQVDQALEILPALEPSPYFDQRLNARLNALEKQTSDVSLWKLWMKDRYVWTFAVLLLATVGLWLGFRHQQYRELDSMEKVLKVQDDFLGEKRPSNSPPLTETVTKETPSKLPGAVKDAADAGLGSGDEVIPEEDLAVVKNFELLQNYDFLKDFELADTLTRNGSGPKAN
jgi:hypothetical protein